MDGRSKPGILGAGALAVTVGVVAFSVSSVAGYSDVALGAALICALGSVCLRPKTSSSLRSSGSSARGTGDSQRRTDVGTRTSVAQRSVRTPPDELAMEEAFNRSLYYEIQADLRRLDEYGPEWAEHRYYYDKIRSDERRLAQSSAKLRTLAR